MALRKLSRFRRYVLLGAAVLTLAGVARYGWAEENGIKMPTSNIAVYNKDWSILGAIASEGYGRAIEELGSCSRDLEEIGWQIDPDSEMIGKRFPNNAAAIREEGLKLEVVFSRVQTSLKEVLNSMSTAKR